MMKRMLPVCVAALTACGPEVRAHDVPSLDGRTETAAAAAELANFAATSVTTPTMAQGDGAGELTVAALLYSELDADVGARADGVVATVRAELGDAVRAGQVLATLDDALEVARAAAAHAALDRARLQHDRVADLHAGGFVTQAELDEARYQLRTAEAELQLAQVELSRMQVLAPFDGVVTRRLARRGQPVREAEPLYRVTSLAPLRASVRLPEREARGLRAGATGVLFTEDGLEVDAVVARIAPAVEPGSGTVEAILHVARPGALLPGSSALLRLSRPVGQP